jgi:hypothetical protein
VCIQTLLVASPRSERQRIDAEAEWSLLQGVE